MMQEKIPSLQASSPDIKGKPIVFDTIFAIFKNYLAQIEEELKEYQNVFSFQNI